MLIRILADNPGPTFTRNVDSKFISVVKELLRNGRDPSVQQILRETLQALYIEKAYDTNLQPLSHMWSKEQGSSIRPAPSAAWIPQPPNQQYIGGSQPRPTPRGLPAPAELAARIEEARTSAKLLQQLIQSTAPQELQSNDLVKEFAERCQAAQRSMQSYMNCDSPPPDDDTMQTLIETSEQLSLAASKHSRAVLQARRSTTQNSTPPPQERSNGIVTTAPVASATFVPAGRPPVPAPVQSPPAPYSPPPIPPPTVRANPDRRYSQDEALPNQPSRPDGIGSATAQLTGNPPTGHQPTGPVELPTPSYDNPFLDQHQHAEEYDIDRDDLYADSPTASNPVAGYGPTSYALMPHQQQQAQGPSFRPAPPQAQASWRQPVRGADTSYAPGYTSTPSYIRRQESSGEHATMHGASALAGPDQVSPEFERGERIGRGVGTVVGASSEVSGAPSSAPSRFSGSGYDVSPIEAKNERGFRSGRS